MKTEYDKWQNSTEKTCFFFQNIGQKKANKKDEAVPNDLMLFGNYYH